MSWVTTIPGLILMAIIAGIVFVQAGKNGGVNGGQQSATIIKAAGSSGSSLVSSLETGSYNAVA
ncbi:MAG: hypothetical protein ACYCSN_13535 [Acidobacteriaceae bacterium]